MGGGVQAGTVAGGSRPCVQRLGAFGVAGSRVSRQTAAAASIEWVVLGARTPGMAVFGGRRCVQSLDGPRGGEQRGLVAGWRPPLPTLSGWFWGGRTPCMAVGGGRRDQN